ncbi:asparagine synthetase [Alternaria alternata]|nr:asparagine synthetase [Alternaria alternata]
MARKLQLTMARLSGSLTRSPIQGSRHCIPPPRSLPSDLCRDCYTRLCHQYLHTSLYARCILAEWLTQRNVAQRLAIRSIEPNYYDPFHYLYGTYQGSFVKDLPALEEIYVMRFRSSARSLITEKIREKDGQGVRVIFKEKPL